MAEIRTPTRRQRAKTWAVIAGSVAIAGGLGAWFAYQRACGSACAARELRADTHDLARRIRNNEREVIDKYERAYEELNDGEHHLAHVLLQYFISTHPERSVVISAHAIALGLATLAAASSGETQSEILKALGFTHSVEELIVALNVMEEEVRPCTHLERKPNPENPRRAFIEVSLDPHYHSGVGVWFPSGLGVTPAFARSARTELRASLWQMGDAWTATDLSNAMNGWRRGIVDELMKAAEAVPSTSSITVSTALDIRVPWGAWAAAPAEGTFRSIKGRSHGARFGDYNTQHLESEKVETAQLGETCGVRFAFVLPRADVRPAEALLPGNLEFSGFSVRARLPVFDLQSHIDLRPALESLGVRRIFDPDRAELGCAAGCGLRRAFEHLRGRDHVGTFDHAVRLAHYWQGMNKPQIDSPLELSSAPRDTTDTLTIDRPFFVFADTHGAGLYAAWIADVPG